MKIDTTTIEGYEDMTTEQKLAALEGFEYDDGKAEIEKLKSAVSKANGEAASWKKKHNALLDDDQKAQQENADHLEAMEAELNQLRSEKKVSEYKAAYIAQGYSEELARDTAKALEAGDTATVFANAKKAQEAMTAQIKAELLKDTPRPHAGAGSIGVDYNKEIEAANARGDSAAVAYFTRISQQSQSINK